MKRSAKMLIGFAVTGIAVCAALAFGRQESQTTKVEPVQQGAAINIVAQLNFRYDRTRVWEALTSAEGLAAITGMTIADADREKKLAAMGDVVAGKCGDDAVRILVTALDPNRELRVSLESNDPDFLSVRRFVLATAGNGCVLRYRIQYTDYAPGAEERAANVRKGLADTSVAFRRIAEPKWAPRRHE